MPIDPTYYRGIRDGVDTLCAYLKESNVLSHDDLIIVQTAAQRVKDANEDARKVLLEV